MKVSSAKIQSTQILQGKVADKGIDKNEIRTVTASLVDAEKAQIDAYLKKCFLPIIDALVQDAKVDPVTDCTQKDAETKRAHLKAGLIRNLEACVKLLSSDTGYTSLLLETLKADKKFEGCFPEAGTSTSSTSDATTSVLDLSKLIK